MKRLITVLTIMMLSVAGGSLVWAQQTDPLAIGGGNSPGALEGGYQTGTGLFQFLIIGTPRACHSGAAACSGDGVGSDVTHLWFYTAACDRVDNKEVPLTKNDVAVVPLHDAFVTSNRVGNVLVAATHTGGPFFQPQVVFEDPVVGQTMFIDANRGIGRIEDMARLGGGEDGSSTGWSPYRPAHLLLFAPPDNGVDLFDTVIFRCPQKTALGKTAPAVTGTGLTLGGEMLDLANQARNGGAPGAGFPTYTATDTDLCSSCNTNGIFASKLLADVWDDDEKFLKSVDNITCQCLGAKIGLGAFSTEVRLGDMAIQAKTQSTRWKFFTIGRELFTAALNIQVKSTVAVNFYTRLFSSVSSENIDEF